MRIKPDFPPQQTPVCVQEAPPSRQLSISAVYGSLITCKGGRSETAGCRRLSLDNLPHFERPSTAPSQRCTQVDSLKRLGIMSRRVGNANSSCYCCQYSFLSWPVGVRLAMLVGPLGSFSCSRHQRVNDASASSRSYPAQYPLDVSIWIGS